MSDNTIKNIWPPLHNWARNFCKDRHITYCQLLTMCNLNSCSTYLQYLSPEGDKRNISYKTGSIGRKFIDSLQIFKNKVEENLSLIIPDPPSIAMIHYERYLEIHKELEELGVESMIVKKETYPITLELFVFEDYKISKEEAIEKFKQVDFSYANPNNILFTNVYYS